MKLKQLTIDNIASIEHAEINFDAAPLAGEHLFLITGETGSGKSTIIDCLCLALYGNTPRLKAARKDDYEASRQDGSGEENLKTDDVRQLLRRGAVSADVCLTFDDNDGIPFIAKWHVHRANKKLEKSIKPPERTLMTAEGVNPPVSLQGKKAIDPYITQLIGLDMDQFFRTVVLAQGKFAEFLNSEEKDKATLLEKMTGTDIYAKVGSKIYAVCDDKLHRRDNLLEQLHDIVLLTEEEKEEINRQVAELTKDQEAMFKQCEGAQKMTQWLSDKAKNQQDINDKQRDLEEKKARIQDAAFIGQQQLVTDWDATIEPRHELRKQRQAEQQMKTLAGEKPALQEEYDRLCAALRAAVKGLDTQRLELDEISRYLEAEAPNRGMYKDIRNIKTLLRQLKDAKDNIGAYTTALEQEQKRQPAVKETFENTFKAQQQQERLVKELETQYEQLDVNAINGRKDALNDAKQALIQFKTCNDNISQTTEALGKLKGDKEKEEHALELAKATLDDKRALVKQAQLAVEREIDWNNLLIQAHKSLQQGDTCPLCGNIIEQLNAPKGEDTLEALRKHLKQAEEDLNGNLTAIAASDKNLERLKSQIGEAEKDLDKRFSARLEQWQETSKQLSLCGKQAETMADNTMADTLIAAMDKDIDHLNERLRQANDLNNRITAERKQLTQFTLAHNNAKIDLNKVNESITHQQEAIHTSTERVKSLTEELNGLFVMADWQERLAKDDSFITDMENKANDYQAKETKAQSLRENIGRTEAVIPAMQDNKSNIKGLDDNGTETAVVPDNLDEQWRKFENRNIDWNNRLDNERDKSLQARQALENYLGEHPAMSMERLGLLDSHQQADIDLIRQQHKDLADNMTHLQGEISALTKRQEDIISQKPAFHVEDLEQLDEIYRSCHLKYEELTNTIIEFKTRLKTDQENTTAAGEKKKALDEAEADYKRWAALCDVLGSRNGDKFKKIAQSYILGELLHSANGYLHQFNDRYELEAKPGSLIILVRDLLQGDLTSVNTLSGGESFMVSLALALALSSTTGKMFSVDTLFIDEGFGSLSENYLDNVMETLNRLYDMGGRRVGIISHVKLLKERVSTQIQVSHDPKNNTVSRIEVI